MLIKLLLQPHVTLQKYFNCVYSCFLIGITGSWIYNSSRGFNMEFMSLIYACISALVVCTSNKIVLVFRSRTWLCWGCARTCPCVRMFTAQVKGGEDSKDYGVKSSKTVGAVWVCYGSSSSSSFLSSFCSEPCNSCWIFPLRMISLLFESMWNVSSADTGRIKQLFRDLGTKVENLNEETMVWLSPCGRTCQGSNGNWNSFTCNGWSTSDQGSRFVSAQAVVAPGVSCRY